MSPSTPSTAKGRRRRRSNRAIRTLSLPSSPSSSSEDMPAERALHQNLHHSQNPQGRQKSCGECARAKRRCDLRQPRCMRCSKQSLECIYPPQPRTHDKVSGANETPGVDNAFTSSESGNDGSIYGADLEAAQFPLQTGDLNIDIEEFPAPETELLDFDFDAGINSLHSLDDMLQVPDPEFISALTVTRVPPLHDALFSMPKITSFQQSRLDYSIEQLKLVPQKMVNETATPWCHPRLYEDHMPISMQNVYGACALYVARNPTNSTSIIRHLAYRIQELTSVPIPAEPLELLARAHALLLHQTMLVFGNDIGFYAHAEALLPHLQIIRQPLLTLTAQAANPVGQLPLFPSTTARAAWKSFIHCESARRTLLTVEHLIAISQCLFGRVSTCTDRTYSSYRVTLQKALWEADSAFDFAVAWNEKDHFLVKGLDYEELLRVGSGDDLDVFGKMILTGSLGLDDVRAWCYTKGTVL